jgi:hypothetical protein
MASSPKAPDPKEQANANNSQQAWASMFNQVGANADVSNPYGQTKSNIVGYVPYTDPYTGKTTQIPRWQQNTTLSPVQQALFDAENRGKQNFADTANEQLGLVRQKLSKPIDYSQFNDWRGYESAPGLVKPDQAYRDKIMKDMETSYQRGIQPQYAAEDAQSAARGMGAPGSKFGYMTERGRYDAADEAARQRYAASGEEARAAAEGENKVAQQGWINTKDIIDQNNAMRQGRVAEAEGEQTNILNRLLAMFGQSQATIPNAPTFQSSPVNAFDAAGAMDKQYQYKLQAASDKNKGLFGIGGNILSMFNPLAKLGMG